ncbi:unnamed protein product [Durusdinium trenchii]|uniref:Uncharacterized protein n=1 Tax=Durusdinium trenchii TaxID=1381693 RepID=A0ABP0S3S5_9DINO
MVHPESKLCTAWGILACFVIFWSGVEAPLEVYHLPPFMVDIMLAIRIVWLCFWVVDILFTCSTAIYVDGTLVTSRKAIVKAYAKSWLLCDLIVLGVDTWSWSCLSRDKAIVRSILIGRFIFFARLLPTIRYHKLLKVVPSFGVRREKSKLFLKMFILLFILASSIHLLAALWFVAGDVDGGWVDDESLQYTPLGDQYMRSVEWALSRLPAAAMGSNMNLNTGLERGLAILATFTALLIGSLTTSVVTNTLANLNRALQEKRKILNCAWKYCSTHGLSRSYYTKIKKHMEREQLRNERRTCLKTLQQLPKDLVQELFAEARCKILSSWIFFHEIAGNYGANMIVCNRAVSERFFLAKDVVFKGGLVAQGMLMLSFQSTYYSLAVAHFQADSMATDADCTDIVPPTSSRSARVADCDSSAVWPQRVEAEVPMAEHALWLAVWQHEGTLQAKGAGVGLCVLASEFLVVLAEHPAILFEAIQRAHRFLETFQRLQEEEEGYCLSDLPLQN